MNNQTSFLDRVSAVWNAELFSIGNTPFTLSSLMMIIISLILLFYLAGKLKKLLIRRILSVPEIG